MKFTGIMMKANIAGNVLSPREYISIYAVPGFAGASDLFNSVLPPLLLLLVVHLKDLYCKTFSWTRQMKTKDFIFIH